MPSPRVLEKAFSIALDVDRTVEVDTGESVAFRYEPAGLGSRFLAVFIDLTLQISVLFGISLASMLISLFAPNWFAHVDAHVLKLGHAMVYGALIFALFLLFFGYFIIFEWLWNGRTPGKSLVGIRVVRDGGYPMDFIASVIRNVVRLLESVAGFYLLSAVSALLSPQNKRLGDFAAGTIVVRDLRYERYHSAAKAERKEEETVTADLSEDERAIIRRYAQRCANLETRARREIAGEIAVRIRPRLRANFGHLSDEDLLAHLIRTAL